MAPVRLVLNFLPIFLMVFFSCPLTLLGGPGVISVFPKAQAIQSDLSTEISVFFDAPVNPATIDQQAVFVFGRWSGVHTGVISFEANSTTMRFLPDTPFMAGEWVTVSLARSITGVDGEEMEKGYTWNFWTATAAGVFDFELIDTIPTRAQNERLVRSYGAYAGDLNRDGYSDLMIPNEVSNDIRIFLNDQAGGYSDYSVHPIPNGSVPSTNEGSDFNRDGLIDFAVGNTGNDLISIWMGTENGIVEHKENRLADQNIRGLCVMDLDGDAVMDVVTANRTGSTENGNISLLINDGRGDFSDPVNIETNSSGETACASIDANDDGILDVFIGAFTSNEVLLFLGDGAGNLVFSDKRDVGNGPWMLAAGDVNGDGFADVVSSNTGNATVSVLLGDGAGMMQNAQHYNTGVFPLAIDLGDLDGDGDLDLVTSNFSSNNYTVLENEGDGSYTARLTLPATTAASCTILHDRDNDGDLDITGIDELADQIFLFDNVAQVTGDEEEFEKPFSFEIDGSYPNPFTSNTTLTIRLKDAGFLSVAVYNTLGQKITTVFENNEVAGNTLVMWDGTNSEGQQIESGVYFYRVKFNNTTQSYKVVLL
ncbi:MAG: FG-GAP-like repeat-containing protein [Rhodothermales bacterium]